MHAAAGLCCVGLHGSLVTGVALFSQMVLLCDSTLNTCLTVIPHACSTAVLLCCGSARSQSASTDCLIGVVVLALPSHPAPYTHMYTTNCTPHLLLGGYMHS